MLIIPAIDIKGGRCVRLRQGRMDQETVYPDDPMDAARKWQNEGAGLIHIVDLDAACEGKPVNTRIIEKIASSVNVPIQVGGGVRDISSAERYLSINGVERVVVGTAAITDGSFLSSLIREHPGRVAVGIDAKDGLVAVKGWVEVSSTPALELAKRLDGSGAACIIYTDISRDGMLTGPNVRATARLAGAVAIPVIASGGVSKMEDIEELKKTGVIGVIVGKALYSGAIELGEAIKRAAC